MFSLFANNLARTARRLVERSRTVCATYLDLEIAELRRRVQADIPRRRRQIAHREVTFSYEDLEGFSFTLADAGEVRTLRIQGHGKFAGFSLQRPASSELWWTGVQPAGVTEVGPSAAELSSTLVRDHGVAKTGKAWGQVRL